MKDLCAKPPLDQTNHRIFLCTGQPSPDFKLPPLLDSLSIVPDLNLLTSSPKFTHWPISSFCFQTQACFTFITLSLRGDGSIYLYISYDIQNISYLSLVSLEIHSLFIFLCNQNCTPIYIRPSSFVLFSLSQYILILSIPGSLILLTLLSLHVHQRLCR